MGSMAKGSAESFDFLSHEQHRRWDSKLTATLTTRFNPPSAVTMDAAPRITKKQKKAIAFKANKGKGKKEADDQLEVPEQEDLDSIESSAPDKKRKRDQNDQENGEEEPKKNKKSKDDADKEDDEPAGEVVEGEGERKKKRQRGKKKSVQRGTKTEDGQPRFVLFVGRSSLSSFP